MSHVDLDSFVLILRPKPRTKSARDREAVDAAMTSIRTEFDLPDRIGRTLHVEPAPTPERLDQILSAIDRQGLMVQTASCHTTMTDASSDDGWCWFEKRSTAPPPGLIPIERWDNAIPGIDVYDGPSVTPRLRAAMESAGLRGIRFVPLADPGRFKAEPLFEIVPTSRLGRRVDHPWRAPGETQQPECVRSDRIRDDAPTPPIIRCAAEALGDRFIVTMPPVLVRAPLLQAGLDVIDDRWRMACSPKAARLLREHGVPARLLPPIRLVSAVPDGADEADFACEAVDLRGDADAFTQRDALVDHAAAGPRPERVRGDQIDTLLECLAPVEEPDQTIDVTALRQALNSINLRYPERFLQLALGLPASSLEMTFFPVDQVSEAQEHTDVPDADPLRTDTPIVFAGATRSADRFLFDGAASTMPDDAPVLRWSHEHGRIIRRWPSVAALIEEFFTART